GAGPGAGRELPARSGAARVGARGDRRLDDLAGAVGGLADDGAVVSVRACLLGDLADARGGDLLADLVGDAQERARELVVADRKLEAVAAELAHERAGPD